MIAITVDAARAEHRAAAAAVDAAHVRTLHAVARLGEDEIRAARATLTAARAEQTRAQRRLYEAVHRG